MPDLPRELSWPEWQGAPLGFITQLNLPELALYDREGALPRTGMLSFFYDAEQRAFGFDAAERDAWRVLYYDGDLAQLARTPAPPTLPAEGTYPACALECSTEWTLPPLESLHLERVGITWEAMYGPSSATEQARAEGDRYLELCESLARLYGDADLLHRVLGHPDPVQGDMQLECQLASHSLYTGNASGYRDPRAASLRAGATDWRLLLQIDSDDEAGMMWGDVGRIYYWIQQERLAKRDFSNVWFAYQCS